MAKSLYGAYRAAGRAGGAYRSSLQDIQNVGYEMEASTQMFEKESDRREELFTTLGEGTVLASNILERAKSSAELERGMENLGKEKYEKLDLDEPWEDLDIKEKAKYMPMQTYGKGSIWEKAAVLGGGAEPLYEFEGKEYSKSKLQALIDIKEANTLWSETNQ